jgi:hypothetical protein
MILSDEKVDTLIAYLYSKEKDVKEAADELGKKAGTPRSKSKDVLLKDVEFRTLLPAFEDFEVVITWIDRFFKLWKNPYNDGFKKDDYIGLASQLGLDVKGSAQVLIKRILASEM